MTIDHTVRSFAKRRQRAHYGLRSFDSGATWESCSCGDVRRAFRDDLGERTAFARLDAGETLTSPRGVLYRRDK